MSFILWRSTLLLYSAFLPLYLWISSFFQMTNPGILVPILVSMMLLAFVAGKRHRKAWILLHTAAVIAFSWIFSFPLCLLYSLSLTILFLTGLSRFSRDGHGQMPSAVKITGFGLYAVTEMSRNLHAFFPFSPEAFRIPFLVSFFIFLVTVLSDTNQDLLKNEIRFDRAVPSSVFRINQLLILLLVLAVLILSSFPALQNAISQLWRWLVLGMLLVLRFLSSLLPAMASDSSSAGGANSFGLMEAAEESTENPLLTYLLSAISGILLTVFLAYGLYRLIKILAFHVKRFFIHIQALFQNASEDYIDEYLDLSPVSSDAGFLNRLRIRHIRPKDAREAIRLAYARILKRHPEWAPGATARETLQTEAAELYERARYSSHAVSDAEADAFYSLTKK